MQSAHHPILIHHIMKTAGTSFIHYLEAAFPAEQIVARLGHAEELKEQAERVQTMTLEDKEKIRVIFGHHASNMRTLFPDTRQGAFFRHPIRRIISHYHFEYEHADAYGISRDMRPLPEEVGEKRFFERVLEMSQEKGGRNANFQTMTLASYLGEPPGSITESAIPGYLEKLSFIGIQEHFCLSAFMLHKLYAFPLIPMPMANHSKKSAMIDYWPQWFIDRCTQHFYLDFLLYKLACNRFDDQYHYVMDSSAQASLEWLQYKNENELEKRNSK